MELHQEISILGLSKAKLHFMENPGMAMGISLGEDTGKLILSIFRICAAGGLICFLKYLIKSKASMGMLLSFSLILAGAIGNIIDCSFYGIIFSESPFHGGKATIFPSEGGYSKFLHGSVVDMLHFPLFTGRYPSWFPFFSNKAFVFLSPVFNIADLAISLGVANTILFHRNYFQNLRNEKTEKEEEQEIKEESEKLTEEDPLHEKNQ